VEKLDIPQGTLDLMILTILARDPLHGYGISQRLTAAGRKQLEQHRERWHRITFAITSVLEGA
jgi:DNA-binding PadR family transcriptional regulator